LIGFAQALPAVRRRTETDLGKPGLPKEKVLAAVVQLLEKTLIRVGNDEYAKQNRSFGLTTLRDGHVEVSGGKVTFAFRGKSGVEHNVSLDDKRLARIIQRCQDLPGTELFQFLDGNGKRHNIASDDVNAHLREITGRDITAKDFRTWGGTMAAAMALRAKGPAASRSEADRNIIEAIDLVSHRLGNTRAVCRKYYVHPALIEAYLEGRTVPMPKETARKRAKRGRGAALRGDEIAVLQFLQEELGTS
jgi:DNA topoisomerase-1